MDKSNQVQSFWKDDELVGAYIFKGDYITDILVIPRFQKKGYGSFMLAHCMGNMSRNKSIQKIRRRVAKSNIGAKKFYEKNGFIEIANFAEHTLVKRGD